MESHDEIHIIPIQVNNAYKRHILIYCLFSTHWPMTSIFVPHSNGQARLNS